MRKRNFLPLIIFIYCLSLISINSFAAERTREGLSDTDVSTSRAGSVVTVSGRLEGEGDSDMVFVLSDSKYFFIEFEPPPPGTDFRAELFWGKGDTTNREYRLNRKKYITLGYLGGMYIKIHSKGGAGGWSFKYTEREDRLIDFTWTITMSNKSGDVPITKIEAIVPYIRTFYPYQQVLESYNNFQHRNIINDNLGNYYYVFEITNLGPNSSVDLVMNYKILLKADYSDPAVCEGGKITGFLNPEPLIESNHPYIINLAREITKYDTTDCDKAKSIYGYVLKRIVYKFQGPMDGALKALTSGRGDCNEFTDAIIALSRASGIPARKGNGFVFFGENHVVAHAFPEIYLPGRGWSVADATMYCLIKRPPFYIYAYFGENPSLLIRPDIENHYFTWWWDGEKQPNFVFDDKYQAKELEW